MRLTAKTIAAITLPTGKIDHFEWDDDLTGYGLRVRQSVGGPVRKQLWVQYRNGAGAQRRKLLGNAAVLSAEQGREAARKLLAQVALGGDPQAEKADRRAQDECTFRSVVDRYLKAKTGKLRARTLVEVTRYLSSADYFGTLHRLALDRITKRDIAPRLLVIEQDRGLVTALRARSHLRAMFTWAIAQGLIETSPVHGTGDLKEPKPRERVLSDGELAAVWRACGDDDFGKIVKLLILTGARRSEIGGLCWSELSYGIWSLPAARSKNDREHVLPLPPLAQSIIETVRRRNDRDQLFGHASAAGYIQWDYAKKALDKRLGDKVKAFTLHDIRRSTATGMANIGVQPHIIEQILNHISGHKGGVAGIYNRSNYEREVRAALIKWADHVSALVS